MLVASWKRSSKLDRVENAEKSRETGSAVSRTDREQQREARRAHCTVWDSLLQFWLLARPMRGVLIAMTHSRTQRSVERAVNVHDVETAS